MSYHPPSPLLVEYRKRTLSPTDFLDVHKHILSCAACYEKCNSPQQLKEDYESLRASLLPQPEETPYHLSPVEAEGYVAGRLDHIDLEIVESHLELCDDCNESIRLLKEEASIIPSQARVGDSVPPAQTGFWRLPSAHSSGQPRMRWGAIGAIAAVVCLMLAATLLLGPALYKRRAVVTSSTPEAVDARQGSAPAISSSNAAVQQSAQEQSGGNENAGNENAGNESAAPAENETEAGIATPRELLILNDRGRRLALDEKGNLSGAERYPPRLQQSIKRMLSTERVPRIAEVAELRGSRSILLGEAENRPLFRLLSPVGKIILSNRPSFNWQTLAGASSYTVTVTDAELNEVMNSGPLTTTSWNASKPLAYGGRYSWQVMAVREGKQIVSPVLPSPPARFKILEQSRVRELERARKRYADSHLALAALYAEAGLSDEAEAELRALLIANPQSGVVRNLLRDIRR